MKQSLYGDWLWAIVKPLQAVFAEVVVISFFINMLALAAPVFVLQVYDRVVGHDGHATLTGLIIGMVALMVFDFVLRQMRSRFLQTVALRIDVQVGRRLFEKLLALPLATLEHRPAATWQGLHRDVEAVRNTLSGASAVLLADLPFLALYLGLVFVVARPIAWVMLLALLAFTALAWASVRRVERASQGERDAAGARDALLAEMIQARGTVKALSLGESLRAAWERRHAAALTDSVRRGAGTDCLVNVGLVLTTLTSVALTSVGAMAIMEHDMTVGALVAANMLTGRLLGPLNQLVSTWRTYSGFRQAMRRLGFLFAEADESQPAVIGHPRPKGVLSTEKVGFSYAGDMPPVLTDLSVTITPGGLTAILGRNGSGKTTLIKVLQGLYRPLEGRVLLDGADMNQFTRAELAAWIGYVPQETVLLDGSIRDNIAMAAPGATDETIMLAARQAGAHDFIQALPKGYGTPVGEAGGRLSGGQRQRLAIARALVGDPPVLILDEPSASLDRQAEEDLRAVLATLARERTVMVVTHSPALLAACRTVVVLEDGKVMAAGPAPELLPTLFPNRAAPHAPARRMEGVA